MPRCSDGSMSGYLALLRVRKGGLPRWALCRPDGSVVTSFEASLTQDDVRRILEKSGLILQDNERVVPAEPAADRVWELALSRLLPNSDHFQAGEKQPHGGAHP